MKDFPINQIEQRRKEKEKSRQDDCARLADGSVSKEELSRENGLFSSLPIRRVRIIDRRLFIKAS